MQLQTQVSFVTFVIWQPHLQVTATSQRWHRKRASHFCLRRGNGARCQTGGCHKPGVIQRAGLFLRSLQRLALLIQPLYDLNQIAQQFSKLIRWVLDHVFSTGRFASNIPTMARRNTTERVTSAIPICRAKCCGSIRTLALSLYSGSFLCLSAS